MKDNDSIPASLQIVALLFLLTGICGVIGMVLRLVVGSIHLDLSFLGIPTYFGLRRFSCGWRTFALVCIWFALILCPVVFMVGIFGPSLTFIELFGIRFRQVSPIWLSIASVLIFLLHVWQYRVLTRPDIRDRFYP